jgi:hypothetical protein
MKKKKIYNEAVPTFQYTIKTPFSTNEKDRGGGLYTV